MESCHDTSKVQQLNPEDTQRKTAQVIIYKEKSLENLIITSKSKLNNQRTGRWDQQENQIYKMFLSDHLIWFKDTSSRKYNKIFTIASQQIINRSATQIRSHHQKMMQKYGSVENIINETKLIISSKSLSPVTQTTFNSENLLTSQTFIPKSCDDQVPNLRPQTSIFQQNQSFNENSLETAKFNLQFKSPQAFIQLGQPQVWKLQDLEI